jgi:hypothetical protein
VLVDDDRVWLTGLRRIVVEAELEFRSACAAADALRGNRSFSYARSAASHITWVSGDGLPQFSSVVHCEIGSFASERRHEVRRVADHRYPMYTIPSVLNRKRMDGTRHEGSFTVGDERCQLWSPAVELFGNVGRAWPRTSSRPVTT